MATLDYIRNKSIDVTVKKYDILLVFLNALLTNMGKQHINDIADFKMIRRDELLTELNESCIDQYKDQLHTFYSKHNTKYLHKKSVKNYILTFLKALVDEIGLDFCSMSVTERDGKTTKTHVLYSIMVPKNKE